MRHGRDGKTPPRSRTTITGRTASCPKTIVKSIRDLIEISASPTPEHKGKGGVKMTRQELAREIEKLEAQMRKAAHMMEYEYAAVLRDEIIRLRTEADKK